MMFYLGGQSGDWVWPDPLPVFECHAILRKASIPLMVDAANMLPPWDNVHRLGAMGVEMICISGGKHMRGPQCSGILAGRADLIRAARLNSSPNEDALGRPMKVGREEIVGVWLAAERYAGLDFAALDRACQSQAEYLRRELGRIEGLRTKFSPFDRTRRVHRVIVEWDEPALGITAAACERKLLDGEPRIAVLRNHPQGLMFTVFMNDEGDEIAAVRRMREIFGAGGC
jgi:L-seryl-tRNA(Ser) seleniumtransferase